MQLAIYQVDAFTSQVFQGNPAAVCPLDSWLEDSHLQAIAAENNLSETAFFVGGNGSYDLRWFTPTTEIDLCGHATLASAYVIFNLLEKSSQEITFSSQSGPLGVKQTNEFITLDFPARPPNPVDSPAGLLEALGGLPVEVHKGKRDHLVVYEREREIRELEPNMSALEATECDAVCVTAPGVDYDCVSRFFAPKKGVPEDPVTGSAHCVLAPYWGRRLNKAHIHAFQASARGGQVICDWVGDRVHLSGKCALYLQGTIAIPD